MSIRLILGKVLFFVNLRVEKKLSSLVPDLQSGEELVATAGAVELTRGFFEQGINIELQLELADVEALWVLFDGATALDPLAHSFLRIINVVLIS